MTRRRFDLLIASPSVLACGLAAAAVSVLDLATTQHGLGLIAGTIPGWVGAVGVQITLLAAVSRSRAAWSWRAAIVGLVVISVVGTALSYYSRQGQEVQRDRQLEALRAEVSRWAAQQVAHGEDELVRSMRSLETIDARARLERDLGREGRPPGAGPVYKALVEERRGERAEVERRAQRLAKLEAAVAAGPSSHTLAGLRSWVGRVEAHADAAAALPPQIRLGVDGHSSPVALARGILAHEAEALTACIVAVALDAVLILLILATRGENRMLKTPSRGSRDADVEAHAAALLPSWSIWSDASRSEEEALALVRCPSGLAEHGLDHPWGDRNSAARLFVGAAACRGLVVVGPNGYRVPKSQLEAWTRLVALLVRIERARRSGPVRRIEVERAATDLLDAPRVEEDVPMLLERLAAIRREVETERAA